MTLSSCQDDITRGEEPLSSEDVINVGADATGVLVSTSMAPNFPGTRATDGERKAAETVPWLVQPLKNGLDITYGKVVSSVGEDKHERVAILKLSADIKDGERLEGTAPNQYAVNSNSGFAVYTFEYRSGNNPALWYGNGLHYFEGVHVPNRIRYTSNPSEIESDRLPLSAVTNITTDQSENNDSGDDNSLSNYYLLSHYLGMPANTRLSATVSRILLPFRHRLAHVLAYIIIDPSLGTKINGYDNIYKDDQEKPFRDDPRTSSIRFCNVDVLEGVKDVLNSDGVHTLTPTWQEKVRKVIPHFKEEASELVVYETAKKKLYPKTDGYDAVNTKFKTAYDAAIANNKTVDEAIKAGNAACGYERKVYEMVPVYDLIVRPTYSSYETVMYDEEGYDNETARQQLADKKNQINFEVGLENNLNYEKHFEFDLDANFETVVYLQISREGVDYNASGSAMWQENLHNDDWYGVDNQNGNTLSMAGSTWQRAFYCGDDADNIAVSDDKVTDGGFYNEKTDGEDGTKGQYVRINTWKEYFSQAYEGGEHHGDYFVLSKDIEIDATTLPADGLVFTGHLDGFNTHGERAYHKITLKNVGVGSECNNEPLSKLYQNSEATEKVPDLYWFKEVAEGRPTTRTAIDPFVPSASDLNPFNMDETYPTALEGYAIYFKDTDGVFKIYTNRIFYKKSPSFLFSGLNGIYETNQEQGKTPWEANVHKEGEYWLPYRDISDADVTKHTGWRAEVLNLTVIGGSLFKEGAVITGNVNNCKDGVDGTHKVDDHTPAMPRYK